MLSVRKMLLYRDGEQYNWIEAATFKIDSFNEEWIYTDECVNLEKLPGLIF